MNFEKSLTLPAIFAELKKLSDEIDAAARLRKLARSNKGFGV